MSSPTEYFVSAIINRTYKSMPFHLMYALLDDYLDSFDASYIWFEEDDKNGFYSHIVFAIFAVTRIHYRHPNKNYLPSFLESLVNTLKQDDHPEYDEIPTTEDGDLFGDVEILRTTFDLKEPIPLPVVLPLLGKEPFTYEMTKRLIEECNIGLLEKIDDNGNSRCIAVYSFVKSVENEPNVSDLVREYFSHLNHIFIEIPTLLYVTEDSPYQTPIHIPY